MTMSFINDEAGLRALAVYCAQLVKECVTFTIRQDDVSIEVELTGGF